MTSVTSREWMFHLSAAPVARILALEFAPLSRIPTMS
jgi:hypothetical protein